SDERSRPVAAVADDDVLAAVARDVADADAGCESEAAADADAVRHRRCKGAPRQLRNDYEVRPETLSAHHDEVVEAVARDVADLEILVAAVRGRVLLRGVEAAMPVVEEDIGCIRPPADP